MTASAQLSHRPATSSGKVVPRDVRRRHPPARGRSFSARPVPLPAATAVLRRPLACPAPLLAPAVAEVDNAPPVALRSGRMATLVVSATVMLAVVGGLDWTGSQPHAAIPADTVVTRVGAGETVWDVAQRVAPRADQRAVVQRIRQLNGIVGSAVVPGQQLHVPDGMSFLHTAHRCRTLRWRPAVRTAILASSPMSARCARTSVQA